MEGVFFLTPRAKLYCLLYIKYNGHQSLTKNNNPGFFPCQYLGWQFHFRCPFSLSCNIHVNVAFSPPFAPLFYYLKLPYFSGKDSNEIIPLLSLKWCSLTHRTIIHMHSHAGCFAPDVLCMYALSLAIINPRSLSFTQINRPAHKQNELLMIH